MNDVDAKHDDGHGTPVAVGLKVILKVTMASLAREEMQYKEHG